MSTLYLIATPIGNLEDLTFRARRVLSEVDALACEDTRRTRVLLERHGIARPGVVFSCHEHNEHRVRPRILSLLGEGKTVGFCSNAGMPCISDPGYLAVTAAIEAGFEVQVIPGAGAVETALGLSGLPCTSYTFKGFPPKKAGRRKTCLEAEREASHTLVFFESPLRLESFLAAAFEVLGDRKAAVCVELTKVHERVHRGFLSDLRRDFSGVTVKGEVTIVIAGNHPKFVRDAPSGRGQQSEGGSDGM